MSDSMSVILFLFDSRDDLYCSCRWRGGKPPKFWWQISVVLLGSVVGGNMGQYGLGRILNPRAGAVGVVKDRY